jgi:hypothetical protein
MTAIISLLKISKQYASVIVLLSLILSKKMPPMTAVFVESILIGSVLEIAAVVLLTAKQFPFQTLPDK